MTPEESEEAKARAERRWPGFARLLISVVDRATPKEAAYVCGVTDGKLLNGLHERDRHSPRLQWILGILESASPGDRLAVLRFLAEPFDLEVVERETLTPEQKLARLEQEVRRFYGPSGEAAIRAAYGRR